MTRTQLLQAVSEEDILKKFLPEYDPASQKNYRSPFAEKDDHPSLSIYRDGEHLKFKSHNTGHQGDVFQFVADLNRLDCKTQFEQVLEVIAKEFKLNGYSMPDTQRSRSVTISFEKQYTKAFLDYFAQFGIREEILRRYDVQQVKYHEFHSRSGKLCKFDYSKLAQVAVCYRIGGRIKVYFPGIEGVQEKTFGFKDQVSTDVFGMEQLEQETRQLPGGRVTCLYIAAGEKDCLALRSRDFPAISFQSENTMPSPELIEKINRLALEAVIVYDNDDAGHQHSARLQKLTGWPRTFPPTKDVAEYFRDHTAKEFMEDVDEKATMPEPQPKEKEAPKAQDEGSGAFTVFHMAEKYLSKRYDLRYNTIKLELELSPIGANRFEPLNENNIFVEINKHGIKIGMDKLIALLKSSFVPRYNPLQEYFRNLPEWDGEYDYISQLAQHLQSADPLELIHQFRKWMVRCVRCIMEPGYYNKQAFILVHSQQNSGKTSFCRFLCPPALKDYMAENISDDKDSRIAIAKNFLINLDELSSLAKHEINSLKALFSKDVINERLPYDRKNSIIHRVASFIGSTNMAEFLTDETGSVRWLCFEIRGIDWNYRQRVDIDKVWAMAYDLYKLGYECDMTREDIERNEQRNTKFQQLSAEAEIIPQFLRPGDDTMQNAVFLTATEILMYISGYTTLKLNKVMIGRAMPVCGFQRVKDRQSDRYGYWCIKLKEVAGSTFLPFSAWTK